jgi:hypothetical protein
VELCVVIAAVLAVATDAVLVAHHLPNIMPIWLPHWKACTGKKRAGRSGEKRVYPEREIEVDLPLQPFEPCKARSVWAGAVAECLFW